MKEVENQAEFKDSSLQSARDLRGQTFVDGLSNFQSLENDHSNSYPMKVV